MADAEKKTEDMKSEQETALEGLGITEKNFDRMARAAAAITQGPDEVVLFLGMVAMAEREKREMTVGEPIMLADMKRGLEGKAFNFKWNEELEGLQDLINRVVPAYQDFREVSSVLNSVKSVLGNEGEKFLTAIERAIEGLPPLSLDEWGATENCECASCLKKRGQKNPDDPPTPPLFDESKVGDSSVEEPPSVPEEPAHVVTTGCECSYCKGYREGKEDSVF